MKIASSAEMQEIDRKAREDFSLPTLLLMENAGERVAEMALDMLDGRNVVIVAGKGNNGGDGIACARHLFNLGVNVKVILLARKDEIKGDARANLEIAERLGIDILELPNNIKAYLEKADLIIDAIFGTGLKGEVGSPFKEAIDEINSAGKPVLSVDIPSGIGDGGEVLGVAVKADRTVTFALPKRGLILYPGAYYAGEVYVADIGIPPQLLSSPSLTLITPSLLQGLIPQRYPDSHKGVFGHLFVLSGSVGYTGAATLCCEGALRVGTGLVTLGIPASLNEIMEVKLTEAMTYPLPETEERSLSLQALVPIREKLKRCTALAIGPGLSTKEETCQLVKALLQEIELPAVIDADALNCLAKERLNFRGKKFVLTPHPGEMARLMEVDAKSIQADRIGWAKKLAYEASCVVVLKGARTVVASPNGECFINPTGNAGMASGGTGDVLTGMIGGFLAQGIPPLSSAILGVFLHGLSGDLAKRELGEEYMCAGDLPRFLPRAFELIRSYRRTRKRCVKLLDWL
ncbi:MAG: NAD(P)H-hydrate dehydratase [bacterium]